MSVFGKTKKSRTLSENVQHVEREQRIIDLVNNVLKNGTVPDDRKLSLA
jgi:hypothetical protein